jgi:DNA-binding IclR family transcriptional regulator
MVLEALARAPAQGVRLTDVAEATGLNKATAHRVLSGLVAHRLAEQLDDSGRFVIGMRVLSWASSASARFNLLRIADKGLERLAQETRDTVYLSIRSQNDLICLDRREGDFPIKTLTLEVGQFRPLGISAGGLALLAFLPDDEVDRVLESHTETGTVFPFDPVVLRQMITATRENGFAYYDAPVLQGRDFIEGMAALAVPVRSLDGRPIAAVSVAALTERLQPPRQATILKCIEREVARIEEALGLNDVNAGTARIVGIRR